ncbi:hypothetical protein [Bradyrhizobium valentinum]|uniref:RelA/SpoT domain-containing protein n=1 Tax=Bradyrhizobium valentinum TaxID=1518501 RepID=A0A0R3LUB5_9BRAD|nr:hypothetical protein [Bradyrhizobium valentinum]KRR05583.1 hypothetical protein CP49_03675 [Bradyrhizobium valentinum]KRR08659.1 hypothetical protein CQ10_13840 [Bradyrhizobium valentinum]
MIDREVYLRLEHIESECVASLKHYLSSRLAQEGVALIVQSRIKSPASVEHKLRNRRLMRGHPAGDKSPSEFVNDFLGIRVVLPHVGQLEKAAELLMEWIAQNKRLGLISAANYFGKPASELYRSYHLDLRFDLDAELCDKVGAEIQVTTYLQNFFNEISHQLSYRQIADRPGVASLLTRVASDLRHLDDDVAALFNHSTKEGY